jgi:hypothetical protein
MNPIKMFHLSLDKGYLAYKVSYKVAPIWNLQWIYVWNQIGFFWLGTISQNQSFEM